jgi:transcriptional regulator with XRE-family HTH domain
MGLTQEKFAELVGVKRSLIGAYEEGRATPPTENLIRISKVCNITLDQLLNQPFYKENAFPSLFKNDNEQVKKQAIPSENLEQQAHQADGEMERQIRELSDSMQTDHFKLVSRDVFHQYVNQYNDASFLLNLPSFQFPNLPKGEYRAFESTEDFVIAESTIICSYVKQVDALENGRNYILVTRKNGILYRRAYDQSDLKGSLLLSSDKHEIASSEIPVREILEIWKAVAYVSFSMPKPVVSLSNVEALVDELKSEISRLKS